MKDKPSAVTFGSLMTTAAALSAVALGAITLVTDPTHKVILWYIAGFFIIQATLIQLYNHILQKSIKAARVAMAGLVPAASSIHPTAVNAPQVGFHYSEFEIAVGDSKEESFGRETIRVNLMDTGTHKSPPTMLQVVIGEDIPSVDVHLSGSAIYRAGPSAQPLDGVNRFRLFKSSLTEHNSFAFSFEFSDKTIRSSYLMVDHINLRAKTARFILVAAISA